MRIGIDAREICEKPAGKGQYLSRLIEAWSGRSDIEIVVYLKDHQNDYSIGHNQWPQKLQAENIEIRRVGGNAFIWHINVARDLHSQNINLFLAGLSYQSAIFNKIFSQNTKTVTIVHDLAVFKLGDILHNKKAQIVERITLKRCTADSAKIIAVSESTKRDLLDIFPETESKISVILEAPMLKSDYDFPLKFENRKPYLLFVGTLEPRKNIINLIKAYSLLPEEIQEKYTLKLAGKKGWGGEDYVALITSLKLKDRIELLGYLESDELLDLYREASLMVYPSLYEGFGLPVIEAMAVGTPVLTSNISSLPEVVGDTCPLCDPNDINDIVKKIIMMLQKEKSDQCAGAVFERSKLFSWEKSGQEIEKIFEEIK